MSGARLEAGAQRGQFHLRGELSFATVTSLLTDSQSLFADCPALEIDLGGVERADSAGLALLAEWLRIAMARRQTIDFTNTPAQLRDLTHVSGLDGVLPFEHVGS